MPGHFFLGKAALPLPYTCYLDNKIELHLPTAVYASSTYFFLTITLFLNNTHYFYVPQRKRLPDRDLSPQPTAHCSINPIQGVPIWGYSQIGGKSNPPSHPLLKSITHIL